MDSSIWINVLPIRPNNGGTVSRTLIIIGASLIAMGVLWPLLARLGIGRLPGDIFIKGTHTSFYFPIVTCLIVSVVLSLIFWAINR